jgi:hypothetical protein
MTTPAATKALEQALASTIKPLMYGIGGSILTFVIVTLCLTLIMKTSGMLNGSSIRKSMLYRLAVGIGMLAAAIYATYYFTNR